MLKLIIAVFVLGSSAISVIANNPAKAEIAIENSDNWVMMKSENGINIYFSTNYIAGNPHLKVKFENTTNTTLNFNWNISIENKFLIQDQNESIDKLSSTLFFNHSLLIPIKENQSFNDFSIKTILN